MREMKDSGIQWLREYPANWDLIKIKYCLKERVEKNNPVRTTDILSLTAKQGVIPYDQKEGGGNKPKEDVSAYRLAYPGDIVMNSMNILSGSVGLSNYFGCVSPVYYMLRPIDTSEDVRFYNYIFQSTVFQRSLYGLGNGILIKESGNGKLNTIRMRIPIDKFGGLFIPVAPIQEQKRIANFLDAKCAEIDALTADIQTQIDILEQYKRSVITEAVTKGLNPDAEMKDSGIDGAGMIPSHWKTTRLCYECYIRARLGWRGLKADEYVDDGYAFISAFNIQNGKLVWAPLNYITKERFDESPEIKLHKGDVLIVKDGAGVGKCARVDDLPIGGTAPNSSIAVITPNESQDYRYVCYYLQSAVFNNFVLLLYNGMGVPHLTQEVMSKIKILVPPLKEQMEISDYLDAKCTEIDSIVEAKKTQHATLDDYKKSLIYEYVTGKKEVPENA